MMVSEAAATTWTWWSVLNAGWFGVAIGVVLSIVATVQGVILYRRGRSVARLRVAITDQLLVETAANAVPGRLEFTYEGTVVPRVTSTSVGIWNDGTTTFRGTDVVEIDPLRLTMIGDGALLQASVEGMSRPMLGVGTEVSAMDGSLRIYFDFLDPADGFRLRVIHSGEPGAIDCRGTVRGLPQGLTTKARPPLLASWTRFGLLASGLFLIISTGFGAFQAFRDANTVQRVTAFGGVIAFIAVVILIEWLQRRVKQRRIKGVPNVISEDDALFSQLTRPAEFD